MSMAIVLSPLSPAWREWDSFTLLRKPYNQYRTHKRSSTLQEM
jgi:hypothetical protein